MEQNHAWLHFAVWILKMVGLHLEKRSVTLERKPWVIEVCGNEFEDKNVHTFLRKSIGFDCRNFELQRNFDIIFRTFSR